jgi:undecaprenyl-diphosphatase
VNQSGDVVQGIVMGLIQGLTEFLPVSSSGHLVIAKSLLGLKEVGITLEIVTHFATAAAVIIFLRKRIGAMLRALWRWVTQGRRALSERDAEDADLLWLVALGTVPAVVVGLALEDPITRLFEDPVTTAAMLVVTGVFLLVTGKVARKTNRLRWPQAILVGLAQAAAIVPGLSRSGFTVGAGLAAGLEKRRAVEFSLLLSLPAIIGATALEAAGGDLGGAPVAIAAAALVAFAVGYAAIALLFRAVVKNRFHAFAYYLIPAGIVAFLLLRRG